jgi:hypothetical protein
MPASSVKKGDEAAVVESVKAASDVYAPVSGEVTEGNQAIADDPCSYQSRPGRRRLVLQAQARRHVRARRADGRERLPRLGEDALSEADASTSRWDAGDYVRVGAFVAELARRRSTCSIRSRASGSSTSAAARER